MIGEIIAIGDELTSGRVLNTNSRFAAGQLFAAGHEIKAMTTVRDTAAEIGEVLKRALRRSDFVIVTGGLGATSDDRTTEAVADVLDRPTTLYPEILKKISNSLKQRNGPEPQTLEKLAWLPEGAEVLKPEARMAGYLLVHDRKPIFFLPGVPHEMRELMADRVLPRLALMAGKTACAVRQRIYKLFGLPEIEINRRLRELEKSDPRVRLGYYPEFPEVHLSLTVMADRAGEADSLFARFSQEIEACLREHIFARDGETMEAVVGGLLLDRNLTLALAESCSGGLIAHKITSIAGSSGYFPGGVVAYSNDLKESLLGVDPVILVEQGAVSDACARAMAAGIRQRTRAGLGLAVTGIAGPSGGSADKPVGTVFFGLSDQEDSRAFRFHFSGNRRQIQEHTAVTGLDIVRRYLLGLPLTSVRPEMSNFVQDQGSR
ncbi:MAG: CinA family nicotinamide mononucleotide deamidase-related protein [Desulfobacterales bacterium]|nr:CinA family nicotinamide mononucleotide deamidase-related protein [Desulfobacterales bacterium]